MPQPEGPKKQMNSPFSIESDTSRSAVNPSLPCSYRLCACSTSMYIRTTSKPAEHKSLPAGHQTVEQQTDETDQ